MKDFKTFSRVKLAENYTHGRIFEKITLKRLKMQNLAKTAQFLAKNGQKSSFSQNGPDRRISDQVFWI